MVRIATKWKVLGIITIASILFLAHNIIFTFNGDDLVYQLSFVDGTPIQDISDVFLSQIAHYQKMNGRIVPHTIAQIIIPLKEGKLIFNTFNTVIFFLVLIIIGRYALGKRRYASLLPYVLTIISLFYILPGRIWEISYAMVSFNYLFVSLLILLFLWTYESIAKDKIYKKYTNQILLFVFGVICGCTHETFTIGLSGAIFFISLYQYWKYKKINAPALVIGLFIGTVILAMSPGILGRAQNSEVLSFDIKGKLINIALTFYHLKLFYLTILLGIVVRIKSRDLFYSFYRQNLHLILAVLFSLCFVMFFAKLYYTNDRAVYGVEFISLLLFIRLISEVLMVSYQMKILDKISSMVIFVLFVAHQSMILPISKEKWDIHKHVRNTYQQSNVGVVTYPDYHFSSIVEPYTIDLKFNYGDGFGTHFVHAESTYKYAVKGNKSDSHLIAVNAELLKKIESIDSKETVNSFYTVPNASSFICPYSKKLINAFRDGHIEYQLAPVELFDNNSPLPLRLQIALERLSGTPIVNKEKPINYLVITSPATNQKYILLPKTEYRVVESINLIPN